jgi:hypothetical protein
MDLSLMLFVGHERAHMKAGSTNSFFGFSLWQTGSHDRACILIPERKYRESSAIFSLS